MLAELADASACVVTAGAHPQCHVLAAHGPDISDLILDARFPLARRESHRVRVTSGFGVDEPSGYRFTHACPYVPSLISVAFDMPNALYEGAVTLVNPDHTFCLEEPAQSLAWMATVAQVLLRKEAHGWNRSAPLRYTLELPYQHARARSLAASAFAGAAAMQVLHAPDGLPKHHEFAELNFSASRLAKHEPAARFLFETLASKQVLRKRNDCCYVALRTWRAQIKKYQLSALKALKQAPPSDFVESAAMELADAALRLYGEGTLRNVVSIPCGSSGKHDCLSVRLGQCVAEHLGLEFRNVLTLDARRGSSHPRNSAQLKEFKVIAPLRGATLLVDDVATSGRHIELAVLALRKAGASVFPMVWIA